MRVCGVGGKKLKVMFFFEKGRIVEEDSFGKGVFGKERLIWWLVMGLLIDCKEGGKYGEV